MKKCSLMQVLIVSTCVVIAGLTLLNNTFKVSVVSGISMCPTLVNNEKMLFNKLDKTYERGDIISFVDVNKGENWVKRVIGVEGDTVAIDTSDNTVILNGMVLSEDYINVGAEYDEDLVVTVPKGHVFVMGDNRNHSCDSRVIGCINTANVIGVLIPLRINS